MNIPKYFFHAETTKYAKALRRALTIVIVPIIALCTFCTANIALNLKSDFSRLLMIIIAASVFLGMVFTFAAVYFTDKLKRRHAKYTFFDILPCGMIFSEYAGEYVHYGEQVILRRLFYLPFDKLESVVRNPKEAPHVISFKGEFREYFLETDRLGYHITEDGKIEFDTLVLNSQFFTPVHEVVVKNRLGNTKALEKSVLFYWEQFKEIPEKKPFDISKFVSERKKRRPKTSNPALEAPSFNRKW